MIPAGTLILARGGSSRDWNPLGVFRAVADIDVAAERERWAATLPAYHYGHGEEFLAWLVDVRGILIEPSVIELTVESWFDDSRPADIAEPYETMAEHMTGPRSQNLEVRRMALAHEILLLEEEAFQKRGELNKLEGNL